MVDTESEDAFKYVCEAVRKGEAVLWAGAGLSAYAGYPAGKAFARMLAGELGENPPDEELILPYWAERYEEAKGRDELLVRMRKTFGKTPEDTETHRLLLLIKRIPYIITTNYDRLFETACGDGLISIASDQEVEKIRTQGWGDRQQILYKIHGDVDHEKEIVITQADYDRFNYKSLLWTSISAIPAAYPIIFIGYKLDDDNTRALFDNIFQQLGKREKSYFIITRTANIDDREWYEKHNVTWIEKDASEAVEEILDYVAHFAVLDSGDSPARMATNVPIFQEKQIDIPYKVQNGKISNWSVRSTNPRIPLTITGNLHLQPKEDASQISELADLLAGRSFESVRLTRKKTQVKFDAEANGLLLIDPEGPFLDSMTITPHPREESKADLQVGAHRIPNVIVKKYRSETHGKVILTSPWFEISMFHEDATRTIQGTLSIHQFADIENASEIYKFFNSWVEGEDLHVIPESGTSSVIPPFIREDPDSVELIRYWHRFFSTLSIVQRDLGIRLQLPEELSELDHETVAILDAILEGKQRITELTLHVITGSPDSKRFLTDKPVDLEIEHPDFHEDFVIFGTRITVPFLIEAKQVVPTNIHEAIEDAARGAENVALHYDGSVGELVLKFPRRTQQVFESGGVKQMTDELPDKLTFAGYPELITDLKEKVRAAQYRAALSVNRELTLLYWDIGRSILSSQAREGWGTKVIDRLAADLRHEFPEVRGFSPRNLKYMRRLAEAWPDPSIVQQLVAQIPWGHNCIILDKIDDPRLREYYIRKAIEYGWSRNVLAVQIETRLHEREGQAITNFTETLPAPQSDLIRQTVKNPYIFDFLSLSPEACEREVHESLLEHLREFLIELGKGFAFLGSEYRLEVGGQEYYLDLLFYNVRLHRYVVIELKVGDFKPEHSGKLNFYLSAVDDILRDPGIDQPSIGLLLCREANRTIAEYALRDTSKPMAVSTYELTRALPAEMQDVLPTVEEIERRVVGTSLTATYDICGPESEPRQDNGNEGAE